MTQPVQELSHFFKFKVARLNRFGIVLVMLYLIITALVLWAAWDAGADEKGRFVLLQLPLALQMALLDGLGLMAWFAGLSWFAAYLIFLPATCVALYYLGKAFTRIWKHNRWLILLLLLIPVLIAYFWADLMILLG